MSSFGCKHDKHDHALSCNDSIALNSGNMLIVVEAQSVERFVTLPKLQCLYPRHFVIVVAIGFAAASNVC